MNAPRLLPLLALLLVTATRTHAAWDPVPPANLAQIKPSDFSDDEIEVPYYLEHFHKVANAVVETGPTRGFINLIVWRRPQDNKPYNVRILENATWFSYFYCTKRPWNPYYGSPAVRQRLEAILDFWVRSQNPDGRFAEYSPTNWTLAPTGFGVMYMSHTLDRLAADGPKIDPVLYERVMVAQRKACLALLTNTTLRAAASAFSNQQGGVYRAATRYLKLRPDTELERAFLDGATHAARTVQSPAGYLYEHSWPDFGYSHVQDNNMLHVDPILSQVPAGVRDLVLEENRRWNDWLSVNLLREPDGIGYFINCPIQRRTTVSFQGYGARAFGRLVPGTRPFQDTAEEFRSTLAQKRARLAAAWPKQPELKIYHPQDYDHNPPTQLWRPTLAQRDAAVARLPYIAQTNFTQIRADPRPLTCVYVRRPDYYAVSNFGENPKRQFALGLSLVWHPRIGTILQTTAATPVTWGTRLDGAKELSERNALTPRLQLDDAPVTVTPGIKTLPAGNLALSYPLATNIAKRVTFENDGIRVDVPAPSVVEQLPFLLRKTDTLTTTPGRVELTSGTNRCVVAFDPSVKVEIGRKDNTGIGGRARCLVRLTSAQPLSYRITFP